MNPVPAQLQKPNSIKLTLVAMPSHEPGASTVTEVTVYSIVTGTRAADIGGVTVSKNKHCNTYTGRNAVPRSRFQHSCRNNRPQCSDRNPRRRYLWCHSDKNRILQYLHWSQCRPINPVPAQLQK